MMRGPAGMGGATVMRMVGRVVGASMSAVQDAVSTAAGAARRVMPPRAVTVSSSGQSIPSSATSYATSYAATSAENDGWPKPYTCFCDAEDWEAVGTKDAAEHASVDRLIFGQVPSREEAVDAVSTIQQVFIPVTLPQNVSNQSSVIDKDISDKTTVTDSMHTVYSESESDWIEPAFQLCPSNRFQSQAREKVIDALHLLQINPSVKRTVISLSSDKAVWEAVMKNEAVQELRKCVFLAENDGPSNSGEVNNIPARILRIFRGTKSKIMELISKITKVVSGFFFLPEDKKACPFEDVLRSSFMLSVVVFIVVIVTRIHNVYLC